MSTRIGSFALVAVLAGLTSLLNGCAADSSDGADATGDETAAVSSASHALSQDLLCAAVAAANDKSGDPSGMKVVAEKDLKGDSLKDFKSFQKNMLPDYPSQAVDLPVKLGGKTYTFLMVVDNNDGGQYLGIYRTDGSTIATVMNSESEQGTWSKPADKCPQ